MKKKRFTGNFMSIDCRKFMWWFLAFVLYYFIFQTFYNKINEKSFFPYNNFEELVLFVSMNFIPIAVVFIADSLIIFRLVRVKDIRGKLAIDFILTNVVEVGVNLLFLIIMADSQFGALNWTGTLFNNFVIFLVLETVYHIRLSRQKIIEAEKKKQTALRYRYNALKAQTAPHFIFNSLNILSALVSLDSEKAKEFIKWLSQVYRYTLAMQEAKFASLKDELAFMESYVNILKLRYNGKFSVTIKGEHLIGNQMIPPYTLQLLIENITKHNTISSRLPMEVTVVIGQDEISVSNPIHFRYSDSPSHFGLRYLTELYASYGRDFRIENDGEVFTAHVPYIQTHSAP